MVSLFIDGAVGTTGLQIGERLSRRADLALIRLSDDERKNDARRAEALNDADIAILCLPDDAARAAVTLIGNPRTRIIDASSAHRVTPGWVYGFPEIVGRDAVAEAHRLSNPGCYATGFVALVAPLVRAGALPHDARITCHAVSGYSGGGKAMIAEFESGDAPTAWRTYALNLQHKHVPEMRLHAGLDHRPLFCPSVANVDCGMIVEVPLHAAEMPPAPELRAILADHYAGSPLITVSAEGGDFTPICIEAMRGCDRMRLSVFADPGGSQVRLIAALDNLGKGASGAAVQSLNLMMGADETTGLRI